MQLSQSIIRKNGLVTEIICCLSDHCVSFMREGQLVVIILQVLVLHYILQLPLQLHQYKIVPGILALVIKMLSLSKYCTQIIVYLLIKGQLSVCTVIIEQSGMALMKIQLQSPNTTLNKVKTTTDRLKITGITYRAIY